MDKVYNPKDLIVNIAGRIVTGFVKDNFITIEPMTKEQIASQVGINGETNVSVNYDDRHKITVNLMGDSPMNSFLDGLSKAKGVPFPMMLQDKSGGKIGGATQCYVLERPTLQNGQEWKDQTWVLLATNFVGAFVG